MATPKILIVEDEAVTRNTLRGIFEAEGYEVLQAQDGAEMYRQLNSETVNLIVLDINLPGKNGLLLGRELREKTPIPLIFLTGRDNEVDKILGLEIGADDYLTKPFAFAELSARVNALGRRRDSSGTSTAEPTALRYGDLSLDLLARRCERQGQAIDLMAKEFKLLEYFMRRPGRLVTRTMLLEQVWDMSFDPTTSVVETHISRLRSKIDKPFDDELIRTRRGEGYVFGK